jgi:hypothetical protein
MLRRFSLDPQAHVSYTFPIKKRVLITTYHLLRRPGSAAL